MSSKTFDIFEGIDLKNVSRFSLEGTTYDCGVYLGDLSDIDEEKTKSDVYDGDTLHIVIMYLNVPHKFTIRMLGIDSPERRPTWKQLSPDGSGTVRVSDEIHALEKKEALNSRNALKRHLNKQKLRVKFGKNDKYGGRILANLFIIKVTDGIESEENISDWMIENNYAVKYFGGKKKAFIAK